VNIKGTLPAANGGSVCVHASVTALVSRSSRTGIPRRRSADFVAGNRGTLARALRERVH